VLRQSNPNALPSVVHVAVQLSKVRVEIPALVRLVQDYAFGHQSLALKLRIQ
jgi:hypothetical protein